LQYVKGTRDKSERPTGKRGRNENKLQYVPHADDVRRKTDMLMSARGNKKNEENKEGMRKKPLTCRQKNESGTI